jgi:hypothetical protein
MSAAPPSRAGDREKRLKIAQELLEVAVPARPVQVLAPLHPRAILDCVSQCERMPTPVRIRPVCQRPCGADTSASQCTAFQRCAQLNSTFHDRTPLLKKQPCSLERLVRPGNPDTTIALRSSTSATPTSSRTAFSRQRSRSLKPAGFLSPRLQLSTSSRTLQMAICWTLLTPQGALPTPAPRSAASFLAPPQREPNLRAGLAPNWR